MKYIWEMVSADSKGELKIDGVDRLLEYPEYSDVAKLKDMLGLMDRKSELFELVEEDDGSDISVYIGKENSMDAMSNSSVIFKKITVNGEVVGAIGVIGPCRMDYSKVISTIRYLSDSIEGRISELTEGGTTNDN
jgi:heat-inducible transcriptional repressor